MSYVNFDESPSSIRGGISGQAGNMETDLYLKKQERTCLYEDSNTLHEHFLSTLRNRLPDPPTMAQYMPKSKHAQNATRKDVMNLRYNVSRSESEPFMPDLFLGFTDKDTRGYHNQPHMEKFNMHSKARTKFIDFQNDTLTDQVVPDHVRSAQRIIKDRRNSINPIKERLKIFKTGVDSRAVPIASHTLMGSAVDKSKHDATLEESLKMINLQNATSLLSNQTEIGYRTTTDNQFNIGKYGPVKRAERNKNIHESQKKTTTTQDYEQDPAKMKNKLMKVVYDELSKQRKESVELDGDFASGILNENFGKRLLKDIRDHNNVFQTQDYTQAEINRSINKSLKFKGVDVFDKALIDIITMKEKMTISRNKKKKNKSINNLSRESYKSSKDDFNSIKTLVYKTTKSKFLKHADTKIDHEFKNSNIIKNKTIGVLEKLSDHGLTTEDHDIIENTQIDSFKKRGGNAKKIFDNTIDDTILNNSIMSGTRTRANILLRN